MANICSRGDSHHQLEGMFKKVRPVLSRVEGKAAAILTSGAYMEYVSTAKWRPAYAKPLRQAGNAAGMSAVALAKAGGFFQHSHLEHSSKACQHHDGE